MRNFISAIIIILTGITVEAQTGNIDGRITTTDGQPAAYVTVQIIALHKGAITSETGRFHFENIRPGVHILTVSHAGLLTEEKNVIIPENKTIIVNFSLKENSNELDQVVIDGRKHKNAPVNIGKASIAPMDLPQSVSIIGQGLIREQQAQRLSDVIRNVNGVYLAATRAGTQETFSARGYGFSNSNMFKNGSRINTGAMPEMSSLEKVEVLKGSAAILYGQVAPGGVLNMVTKQPKFVRGGEVSMRAGSYDLYKPAVDVYGPLSQKIAFRVNGTYESAGSFRHNVHSKRYYVNPSLLFKPGKHTELLVQGDYLKHEFTPDFGVGSISDTVINDVPRNTFYGTPWQYAKTDQATAGINLKHTFKDAWMLSVSTSYQQYKRDYFSTERIQAKANGDWARPLGRTKTDERYYSFQADITGKFKTGNLAHTFLAGIDADRYYTTNWVYDLQGKIYDTINVLYPDKFSPRTDMPITRDTGRNEAPVNRAGAYVQDLIKISNRFNVLAGIRFSYLENTGRAAIWNYTTKTNIAGFYKYESAFSPRLGVVFKPANNISLFTSYSNSFSPNTGYDADSTGLKPSIINQYEFGIKNDLFNGAFSVNVTVYRIVNNNLAQMTPYKADGSINNDPNMKALIGETTSDGVEVDLAAHLVLGLNILAGYSYNDMRVTKSPGTKGSYYVGDRLVQNPHHTANASAFYTIGGLKFGAAVYYTGERSAGWNNTYGQSQTYSRLVKVNGFTTLDISAGYAYKRISFMASLSNLTNTRNYYVHENYSVNPIAPRQLIGTISYRF